MPIPEISEGDIIRIGTIPAVVCTIHAAGDVEVIYRDARHHVIGEDAVWREEDGVWAFKESARNAGWFADKKPRLQRFVEILEAHHKPPVKDFMTRLAEKKGKPGRK